MTFEAALPRLVPAGDTGDTDVYGAQQHGPLLDVDIPIFDSAAGRENLQKNRMRAPRPPRKHAKDQRDTREVRSFPACPPQRNSSGMSTGWQGNGSGIERADISAV